MDITNIIQNLISWLGIHGLKIILILIAAKLINRFFKTLVRRAIKKQIKNRISEEEKRKRGETLISVFEGTFKFIVWIVAILMILPELGINIAPLLAGVGVAGLAIGMAAKGIVSDFISGLFIILEDQYHIGDKIKIAGFEGIVEEITLRRTILKDEEGVSHLIPNSKITIVSKKSQ